jgi:hypothetical protein
METIVEIYNVYVQIIQTIKEVIVGISAQYTG